MNILTFDIEEWFHILDHETTKTEKNWDRYEKRLDANLDLILRMLSSRDLKATFFCLGWIARENAPALRRIVLNGHEIASHSDLHRLSYEQTPKEFRTDLEVSIKSLEDATGCRIRAYRAPGFSLCKKNKWVFEELVSAGIEIDCSIFPANRAHGGFEDFGQARPVRVKTDSGIIKEFPINTTTVFGREIIFSGGGYFRLLPALLIRYLITNSDYVMTYFHPRDFDPGQPMIPDLPLVRRFKSYCGLKGAENKLMGLLDEFPFVSLAEAEEAVHWPTTPIVEV